MSNFIGSTIFNDGDVDIEVCFHPSKTEEDGIEIANHYTNLFLSYDGEKILLSSSGGKETVCALEEGLSLVYRKVTKELGPPIDCSTPEGCKKVAESLANKDPSYFIDLDDMQDISLKEMLKIVSDRANHAGYIQFDSIAYGCVAAS